MNATTPLGARTFLLTALLTVAVASSAKASTIYTYSGPQFLTFVGIYSCPAVCNITGSFTLATALPANFALAPIAPVTYSFTDGTHVFDPTTVQLGSFLMSTDALGLPLFWDVTLQTNTAAAPPMRAMNTSFGVLHRDISNQTGLLGIQPGGSAGCFNCAPGSWSVTTSGPGATVPEPSAWLLLGTGLLLIRGIVGRRLPARTR